MKIAYNPLGSAAYIPAADNKDLIFDLVTRTIYAKGIPFDGTKYNTFKKHTSPDNTGGSEGLVPIPSYSALNNRLLREDGQWVQIAGVSAPDDVLSLESTNSVENKVITKKFNEIIAQLLLKAEHVYKNIVINGVLLQAQGANDTLTIIQGDGITLTPNSDNKAITISTKALGQQGIDISYSEGQLIAKVADTYYARWNEVFNWYQSVTEEDTDQYINKWQEIVDFLNNVQQGTNILDEFVTRKTDQTIIGTKTFSQQIISTVAEGTSPFIVDSSTRVLKLNADMVDDYHIRKWFNNASDIDNSSVLWQSNGECSDIPSMSYSALINVIGGTGRRWQIWNSRNNHQLYWRPELPDMSGYALEHILLDNLNYKGFIEQMYWANVPISATSSTTTSPTFANATMSGILTFTTAGDTAKIKFLNGEIIDGYGNIKLGTSSKSWNIFLKDETRALSVYDSGNVGIGTIDSAAAKLHIIGNTLLSQGANGDLYYRVQGLTHNVWFGLGSGGINRGIWDPDNSNWMLYRDNTTNVLIPQGNVGIGTTSPSAKLHVAGLVNITANSGTLTIGCQNTSWTHYSTTGGTHWFNKAVEVNGNLTPHANNSFTLGTSSKRWSNIYTYRGHIRTALSTALPTYANSPLQFDSSYNDNDASNSRYRPWFSGQDLVTSYGYGVTISTGIYRDPGCSSGGYYIGCGWDGNASSCLWKFSRNGILYGAGGFAKSGSSDSYVLLGGGGHKALSDFAMASAYVKKAGDTMTGSLNFTTGNVIITTASTSNYKALGVFYKVSASASGTYDAQIGWHNIGDTNGALTLLPYATTTSPWYGSVGLYITKTQLKYNGASVWHSGNDGSGSGLDADLLDGVHASGLLTALSSSSATNLSVTVGGTTKTVADMWATNIANKYSSRPTTINPGVTGDGSMFQFKCTSSVTDTTTDPGDGHILHFNWDNTGGYDSQLFLPASSSALKVRGMSGGTWKTWATVLTNLNYTSYLGYIGTTAVQSSSAAQALTGITNATLSGKLIFTTAGEAVSISFLNGERIDGYGNVQLGTNSASWNVFNSSRSSLITVLKSGNVGIGTTSPSYKLHVTGSGYFSGNITVGGDRYVSDSTYGINMQNSDIAQINSLYFADLADSSTEGIHFYRSTTTWDSLTAKNGILYFSGNRAISDTTLTPVFSALANSGNNISITIGGQNRTLTPAYATSAGNADKVDGYHATSFEGYYAYTIDASSLNNNTWYPVTIAIGNSIQTRIRVQGNTAANASWNSRSDKQMSVILDYTVNGSLWGWTQVQRVVHRFELGAGAVGSNCVAGIGQLTNGSTEYVYVRGGAKYNFYISRAITPTLRTATYTEFSQSVGPTTSSPGGITQGYHSFSLYASHFYENSDIMLKTNIKSISDSDNMPILKEFDWKKDGTHGYGLIAQELEAMGYSELVDGEEDGTKTVNYSAALSLIVGKLQVKIKELEKEIEILKNKN